MQNASMMTSRTRMIVFATLITSSTMGDSTTSPAALVEQLTDDVTVESTIPPDGYIYPGEDVDKYGDPVGLDELTVTFSAPVQLTESMISIEVTGGVAPTTSSVRPVREDGIEWEIHLSTPIPPGESTTFVFSPSQTIVISAVPGDVNQDGILSIDDQTDFLEAYHYSSTDPLWHDIDANGIVDDDDYHRLVVLLQGGGSAQPYDSNSDEPVQPVVCCEDGGACTFYFATECPGGTTNVGCPCPWEEQT